MFYSIGGAAETTEKDTFVPIIATRSQKSLLAKGTHHATFFGYTCRAMSSSCTSIGMQKSHEIGQNKNNS